MKQITINFDPTPVEAYGSLVEYIQALTHQSGKSQKAIAADMDLSPSHLSRKLSQSPDDSLRLTVDNLEDWIRVNGGDLRPAFYLIQKFNNPLSEDEIDKRIAELQALKDAKK